MAFHLVQATSATPRRIHPAPHQDLKLLLDALRLAMAKDREIAALKADLQDPLFVEPEREDRIEKALRILEAPADVELSAVIKGHDGRWRRLRVQPIGLVDGLNNCLPLLKGDCLFSPPGDNPHTHTHSRRFITIRLRNGIRPQATSTLF